MKSTLVLSNSNSREGQDTIFYLKGKKVLVIVKEGVVWFKGIDVARILDLTETQNAIQHNVVNEDKITFMTIKKLFFFANKNG